MPFQVAKRLRRARRREQKSCAAARPNSQPDICPVRAGMRTVIPRRYPAMATLIPSLGSAHFDSRGELRLAERLKDFLEDNSYIWHNLPMGPRGRHPDFVIVHPAKGLLVLEVKDWRLDTIASANKSEVELMTNMGSVRTTSPSEQARQYMFEVMKLIQSDGMLLHPPGHAYQGKSIVPFGYGVVFTNINRKQFAQTDLHEVFPEDRCVFKDEMSESSDAEGFPHAALEDGAAAIGSACDAS
jgi:hypothetical protein